MVVLSEHSRSCCVVWFPFYIIIITIKIWSHNNIAKIVKILCGRLDNECMGQIEMTCAVDW